MYFERSVEPHIDGERVRYIGSVGPDERGAVLGGARALLHLISFEEPFGFSVIESMACGTPVIATRRGSMPELVQDGVNGCLVDTPEQADDAVRAAEGLDRRAIRASVEQRFDVCGWSTTTSTSTAGSSSGASADDGWRDRDAEPFRLGINYWPARTAMAWWTSFDRAETAEDFARIADAGFDSVRLFLLWEAFQPEPDACRSRRCSNAWRRWRTAQERRSRPDADPVHRAHERCGLDPGVGAGRRRPRSAFPGRLGWTRGRRWIAELVHGRRCRARAGRARGRGRRKPSPDIDALWAWDLGNENSNCVVPPDRAAARAWLSRMTSAIRDEDPDAEVTIGIHMEDLEEDRRLGPGEAAESCDFLTMHGYPIYARVGAEPDRRGARPVPGPRHAMVGGRRGCALLRVRAPHAPEEPGQRGGGAGDRYNVADRRGRGCRVRRARPDGTPRRGCHRRDALVLLRLRRGDVRPATDGRGHP